MGYRELDEYSDEVLERELARRKKLREQGLCSYCARPLDTDSHSLRNPCKLHERLSGDNSVERVRR